MPKLTLDSPFSIGPKNRHVQLRQETISEKTGKTLVTYETDKERKAAVSYTVKPPTTEQGQKALGEVLSSYLGAWVGSSLPAYDGQTEKELGEKLLDYHNKTVVIDFDAVAPKVLEGAKGRKADSTTTAEALEHVAKNAHDAFLALDKTARELLLDRARAAQKQVTMKHIEAVQGLF